MNYVYLQLVVQMEFEVRENQPKQERSRTKWTASLDKIFADLVVEQIQLGNRNNNVFDKNSWNHIRDEFNRQTNLSFNNNQLRKHLDVLRIRYYSLKSSFDQKDIVIDDPCYIGFDLWDIGVYPSTSIMFLSNYCCHSCLTIFVLQAQPKPETTKIKDCPIFDQLCTIFGDVRVDGKYAQSSHFGANPGDLAPCLENENIDTKPSKSVLGNATSAHNAIKKAAERKRKREAEEGSFVADSSRDQEINNAMAQGMLEMVGALKLHMAAKPQSSKRFTIAKCIQALDEIEGIDDRLYYAAVDLFEDPNLRETFISLKDHKLQWTWLQENCGNLISFLRV